MHLSNIIRLTIPRLKSWEHRYIMHFLHLFFTDPKLVVSPAHFLSFPFRSSSSFLHKYFSDCTLKQPNKVIYLQKHVYKKYPLLPSGKWINLGFWPVLIMSICIACIQKKKRLCIKLKVLKPDRAYQASTYALTAFKYIASCITIGISW